MNTQERVLAMLNKTKEVRKSRKENLGAIEDAVNEAKSVLKNSNDEMVAVTRTLETAIATAEQAMSELISNLSDAMRNSDDNFYNLQMEAFKQQADLDNLGISYETDVEATIEYYNEIYDKADSMIQ